MTKKISRYLLSIFFLVEISGYGSTILASSVNMASSEEIVDFILGDHFQLYLKKDGTVWGFGKNNHGELGVGTTSEEVPIQIQTPSGPLSHVVSISTEKNGTTIVATRDDGSIWRSNDEKIFLKSASQASFRLQSESPNFLRALKTADANQVEVFSEAGDSLPDDWQLKYFGYIGVDPDALAPNGSGLTILQCYLQGIDPVPEEPITMTISATGPFRAPANVTLVASISHPANIKVGHIDFFYGGTNSNNCLGTAATEPYQVTCNGFPAGNFFIQAKAYDEDEKEIATATTEVDVIPSNRYFRGLLPAVYSSNDISYVSSIIALDSQRGVQLDGTNNTSSTNFDNIYSNGYPWFLRASSDLKEPCYHVISANGQIDYVPVNVIPTIGGIQVGDQPPMMAFGSQSGQGTPLYVNQAYHFGIAAGGERPEILNDLKIEV